MAADSNPVAWVGRQAVVTLPEHIDVSNAGQIREELLSLVNRGAAVLTADMTATMSCDHAGIDAVVRAYQRALVSGTQLRLVVTAQIVQRVLCINGLDCLIPIYPSLEAAIAARPVPAAVVPLLPLPAEADVQVPGRRSARARRGQRRASGPRKRPGAAAITAAVLRELVDALADGVALADGEGMLTLANRRLAEMFGYEHAELIGRPVESLIPAGLRAAHRSHRAAYAQAPEARPMGAGARLVGLRKDGATFPVEISLSPVPATAGQLTLAVVRDGAETRRHEDLARIARAAYAAEQAHRGPELPDTIVSDLLQVSLSLHATISLPSEVARQRIAEAAQHLDDTIREIRGGGSAVSAQQAPPPPVPPGGAADRTPRRAEAGPARMGTQARSPARGRRDTGSAGDH
jgi:anti-anti-sigma factor